MKDLWNLLHRVQRSYAPICPREKIPYITKVNNLGSILHHLWQQVYSRVVRGGVSYALLNEVVDKSSSHLIESI